MQFYFFFVVSLIVAAVHIYRDRQPRIGRRIVQVLLLWLLVIDVGVGSVFGFIGHTVFAERAAESIGWPAGNPFQTEVAVANLAIGTLGILCYWIRDNFWTATVIATSVWLLGDAVGHVQQIVVAHNYSPNNAGAALYNDIVIPLILLALLVYYRYAPGDERQPSRVR
jgi:hypothetical protein